MSTQFSTNEEAFLRIGKDLWWAVLIRGIVAIVFGIVALAWPDVTVWALVVVFGAYAIVDGVSAIVRAARSRKVESGWVWWMLGGFVSLAAGIVALVWPNITAIAVVFVIGIWAILGGILEIAGSLRLRRLDGATHWVGLMIAGVLELLFGLILVFFPGSGILGIVWLVGVFALLFGIAFVVSAFQLRSMAKKAGMI
ncbi:HdeD family acid-resistance protein [Rhodococcus sp. H36-A4]|uniref:HdeD family acid-resistance protein n=1 Tax=Rhodococcus sp. H36-A4 TaxID=3004353 RepID=UPI0022AFB5E8|nr:HdeD family acid-resistance protein [Rhodococcus sp. H36-A4]MCZ4077180.1 HdeD family acid-resistance protein [Rhodococcus sp. H36-A4]